MNNWPSGPGGSQEPPRLRQKHSVLRQPSMHGRSVYLAVLVIADTKYLGVAKQTEREADEVLWEVRVVTREVLDIAHQNIHCRS